MDYNELEKLNELKEKGIISEEEFQAQKEKLLNNQNTQETVAQEPIQGQVVSSTVETTTSASAPVGNKSKLAAALFAFFLGTFGVHNFYLGYTGKAVAQLLITLLSCFILSPVSSIWAIVEGVLILTGEINSDASGNSLKD